MSQAVALAHDTANFISVYRWTKGGFGSRFANPGTLPTSTANGVGAHPDGSALAVAHNNSPYVTAYPWSTTGFGTKFANPSTLPGTGAGYAISFAASGDFVAVSHFGSPYISVYPWSSTGFGTRVANPSTLPNSSARGTKFSPDSTALAVTSDGTPFLQVYPWSSSGFGTKFADPGTLPAGVGWGVAFSPASTEIAVAHDSTPFVSAYPWSTSGFGTKFSNPATLPGTQGYAVGFAPDGSALAVGHLSTPFLSVYPWSSSGFGTKFANPGTLPASNVHGTAFSPYGDALVAGHELTPFVAAYPWSGSGFGTKFANPSTLPDERCDGVAFINLLSDYYFDSSSTPLDGSATTNTADPTAVTPPAGMKAGDLVFMIGDARIASLTLAISQAGGQTWTTHAAISATTKSVRVFTCVFNGTWSANPSVSFGSTTCNSVYMHVFRAPGTVHAWSVNQAQVASSDTTDPFSITGQTTTGSNPTVTMAGWHSPDDNTWGTLTGTGWEVTGVPQYRNTSGSDQSASFAHKVQTAAGATGNVGKSQLTLGADTAQQWIITMAAISGPFTPLFQRKPYSLRI